MRQLGLVEIARGRASLEMYVGLTRGLRAAEHHKGIIAAVQPDEWNKGVGVVCPPGSGKSTWISESAPAWLIGNRPEMMILHIHANDDKANAYNTVLQQVYEQSASHRQIFPDVEADRDRGWSSHGLYFKWRDRDGRGQMVDSGGWSHLPAKDPQYYSIGFNGKVTGSRADLLIFDDAFDPSEMMSPTYRAKFKERFKTVFMSRRKPGARVIFICNRWHYDDMVPTLQEMGFPIVTFPAIGEDGDGVERSYWPAMFPIEKLRDIRDTEIGQELFMCLYQGQPGAAEGALFLQKDVRYCRVGVAERVIEVENDDGIRERVAFNDCRWVQAIDPASSKRAGADYFVIATVAADKKGRFFVVDVVREHIEGPDQPGYVRAAYEKWRPYAIGIEKVGYQQTLIQYSLRDGLPIREIGRRTDKLDRFRTLATRCAAHMVYLERNGAWRANLEREMIQAPRSKHDDVVDAVTDATEMLAEHGPVLTAKQLTRLGALPKYGTFGDGRRW